MTDDELDAIARELYALTPDAFTAARNARAHATTDRALAVRVKALRKPVVSAWAVGLLVREGLLAEALALAASLREAQDDLDAAELAALGRQRRQLVTALGARAVDAARERGVTVSAAARDDVEKTVNAAMMDAAAAAAVLSGRLIAPLVAGGFDDADLADAVGGSLPGAGPAPTRDDLAERRARREAEKAAREAERLAGEAAREAARAEAAYEKARDRARHLAERIDDLERDLARLRLDAAAADAALEKATSRRREYADRARAAEGRARTARAALDDPPVR
jgi:hypothetical protein